MNVCVLCCVVLYCIALRVRVCACMYLRVMQCIFLVWGAGGQFLLLMYFLVFGRLWVYVYTCFLSFFLCFYFSFRVSFIIIGYGNNVVR